MAASLRQAGLGSRRVGLVLTSDWQERVDGSWYVALTSVPRGNPLFPSGSGAFVLRWNQGRWRITAKDMGYLEHTFAVSCAEIDEAKNGVDVMIGLLVGAPEPADG